METAKSMCIQAINAKYNTSYDANEPELFFKVEKAPKFKNVFFIRLNYDSEAAQHCGLVRKRPRKHSRGRASYCVNVSSGKVVQMCFSSKCKNRGGKYLLCAAHDETSSEDSDFSSSEDEKEEEVQRVGKKRRRPDDDEKQQ